MPCLYLINDSAFHRITTKSIKLYHSPQERISNNLDNNPLTRIDNLLMGLKMDVCSMEALHFCDSVSLFLKKRCVFAQSVVKRHWKYGTSDFLYEVKAIEVVMYF